MYEHVSLHAPRAGRLAPLIVLSNDRVIPAQSNQGDYNIASTIQTTMAGEFR